MKENTKISARPGLFGGLIMTGSPLLAMRIISNT